MSLLARNVAPRDIALSASMYFSFLGKQRAGVRAETTFEAIINGERASTTRFDKWGDLDRWRRLVPGDIVQFFEDRAMCKRSVLVTVREVRDIKMMTFTAGELDQWSRVEAWRPIVALEMASRYGHAVQVLYDFLAGPIPPPNQ